MTNIATGLIAIVMVLAFLGVMVAWVPAPPLIIIIATVMLLLIVDFVQSLGGGNGSER
jgi:hypothetical protein